MVKNRTKLFSYALPFTAVLTLGCGSGPAEGSASASASSTGGSDTSTSASASNSDPTPGSNSNSDSTPTTTQGSMSDGQTEATTAVTTSTTSVGSNSNTDTGTTSNPVTSDTDGTTTVGDSTGSTSDTTTTGELSASTSSSGSTGDSSSGTTDEPIQCGLQLKATIRDFKIGHPDFETYCCGVVKDLVKPDLGPDKKPVFNQVGNPKMLTDAPTFNQWYNNVQDVNQSTQVILDLMEIQPGVYSYQNNNFFPIDNMLFGNQGNDHNFHFTTEIHTVFTYMGGESFTFTGDDDVWVFINKKLVIDIGGVHGNSPGSVNLDNLGLTMGINYTLDVFHAERHTTQSNFRIDTTICSQPQ